MQNEDSAIVYREVSHSYLCLFWEGNGAIAWARVSFPASHYVIYRIDHDSNGFNLVKEKPFEK